MTQDNLLNQGDTPSIDENKDYLSELVGETKKFKDVAALAKGKAFSDAHIEILERRFDELSRDYLKQKEQISAGARLEELLDKLEQKESLASRNENLNSNEDQKPALGLDAVESLVSSKIQEYEQTKTERENYNRVESKLMEKLGSNYKAALKQKSTELRLSDDEVNTMARRNPNLFFKTFDLNEAPRGDGYNPPPRNSGSFTPTGQKERTWSYYLELKKQDPSAWLDKKIAVQMEKDAQRLGPDFYDT